MIFFTLTKLKERLEEIFEGQNNYKRLEYDEATKESIYQRLPPEIFLFDNLISYKESKMPYVCIEGNSRQCVDVTKIDVTLRIVTKNDGILSWKYDEFGNKLNEHEFEPDDTACFLDVISISEKIQMELLKKSPLPIEPNDGVLIQSKFIKEDFTGNGIACMELYFTLVAPNYARGTRQIAEFVL